jgi:two-component system phosphate regulon response regulator PhoB
MTLRLLFVDDDAGFTRPAGDHCEHNGHLVEISTSAEEAALKLREMPADLVVLAWRLPDMPGIELCRQLRRRRDSTQLPIVMLTEGPDETARRRCLETGADDVLHKPVSPAELMAHIKAVVRRNNPQLIADTLKLGGLELNRFTHHVSCAGAPLKLPALEFRLLMKLMENAGRILPRALLLDHVWGADIYVDERTVDVHIARLRRRLRATPARDAIQTVRGLGYCFAITS